MLNDTRKIIARIGETDQLYLQENTPALALERASLRLDLVILSHVHQERVHFLQEAIVLLEQARISFEEMPMRLYLDLSLYLAKAYMMFFEISHDTKYALVTQQILKPLAQQNLADIYFFLAYASAVKSEPAMTRHWLKKYIATGDFDMLLLKNHSAFISFKHTEWFKQLIECKMH